LNYVLNLLSILTRILGVRIRKTSIVARVVLWKVVAWIVSLCAVFSLSVLPYVLGKDVLNIQKIIITVNICVYCEKVTNVNKR